MKTNLVKPSPKPRARPTIIPPRSPDRVLLDSLTQHLDVIVVLRDDRGRATGAFVMSYIDVATLDRLATLGAEQDDMEPDAIEADEPLEPNGDELDYQPGDAEDEAFIDRLRLHPSVRQQQLRLGQDPLATMDRCAFSPMPVGATLDAQRRRGGRS